MHVITGMGMGGAEKVVTQLASARGASATVAWLTGPNRWAERLEGVGVACQPLGMHGIPDLPNAVRNLVRLIRRNRPEVLHTHLLHAHLVGRWAARIAGDVPVISTEHNLRVYERPRYRWLSATDVRTSRHNRAIVAISEAARSRCVAAGYRVETLHVIYNGVELPSPTFLDRPMAEVPMIVMVGRLHAEKGPDLFVNAIGLLPNVAGLLVGDGEERARIDRLIHSAPWRDRLRWQKEGEAADAFAQALVVVVPSRHEGLGLVALEAMAMAKPVVATCVGGLVEVVEQGVTGLLVPPESPQALADAARRLVESPALCAAMGAAGRKRVAERFTLNKMLVHYESLYSNVTR